MYLGLQNEREWVRFCAEVIGRPELSADDRFTSNSARVAHQDQLTQIITQAFSTLTAADVVARLDAAGIANARMNTMREFLDHPQLAARARWRNVDSPVGPLRALIPPINLDGMPPAMGPIPALGEHTDAILDELGYDAATISRWRQNGIV